MVSACLLGRNCKYNGGNNLNEKLMAFLEGKKVIPVCPEVAGGLQTPRLPAEIVDGIVTRKDGASVDLEYHKGAEACLEIARRERPDMVILQSRSPSCGVNQIYDGTFSGNKIKGSGVFAGLLKENGFVVIDVEDLG